MYARLLTHCGVDVGFLSLRNGKNKYEMKFEIKFSEEYVNNN